MHARFGRGRPETYRREPARRRAPTLRDEHVVATGAAATEDEASREVSAGEIVLEGVDHVPGERRGTRAPRVVEEGVEVLADEAVEHGVVRAAVDIFVDRAARR